MDMRKEKLVDSSLNLNREALCILAELADDELEIPRILRLRTGAWYNGRECGIVLSVLGPDLAASHIVWARCRGSDELAVYWFFGTDSGNPPTSRSLTEEDYRRNRKYFRPGYYVQVADFIRQHIKDAVSAFAQNV